jgi:BlaI family penicillinase repressor
VRHAIPTAFSLAAYYICSSIVPVLTDAEWKVMRCLWDKSPATAREICERLDTGWAYTTVKTFLDRMVEKGAVRAKRRGQADVYTPAVREAAARRDAVRALAAKAFDGAVGPMVHFLVGKLSAKEREEIRRLLEEEGK